MEETTISTEIPTPVKDENWKSEKIDKLAAALSKAQSEMKGAEKKISKSFL